jgi:putative phosphoribosyl transferase
LVDDGIATGATLRAAIASLRPQQPQAIVVAVPVSPPSVCEELQQEADDVVCLLTPTPFNAIGLWYEDFSQTTDSEVRNLLEAADREIKHFV